MKVLGTWNRVQWVQWKYPLIADFPRSLPISQSPGIVGYFSPLMKVLGTWNRVQRVQWTYPLIADFPRSLPISRYTLYSRVFFTPYESTRDVKPHPMSTMNVPFDCRFSSIVADFSVTLYSRVFFYPLWKVLGTWNRVHRVQWKYPLIADFPRSLPISQTPCMVGYFSPLM